MRVLVVEDHEDLADVIRETLERDGQQVTVAVDAKQGERLAHLEDFEVLILDVMLPEGPDAGFQLGRRLRESGIGTPILFLTARADVESRLSGLTDGDDYLTKPFDVRELRARVRALARRGAGLASDTIALPGNVVLDFGTRRLWRSGVLTAVTGREYALLECFVLRPHRMLSREKIIEIVWPGVEDVEPKLIDVYVSTLRRKLGEALIETVRGSGYRLGKAGDSG